MAQHNSAFALTCFCFQSPDDCKPLHPLTEQVTKFLVCWQQFSQTKSMLHPPSTPNNQTLQFLPIVQHSDWLCIAHSKPTLHWMVVIAPFSIGNENCQSMNVCWGWAQMQQTATDMEQHNLWHADTTDDANCSLQLKSKSCQSDPSEADLLTVVLHKQARILILEIWNLSGHSITLPDEPLSLQSEKHMKVKHF